LATDGRCDIHSLHGYAAKPETCRLFPFNSFRQVGPYLVVAPHPDLCPLSIVPAGASAAVSSYDVLIDGLAVSGVSERIVQFGAAHQDADIAIALERQVVAVCEQSLARGATYLDCVGAQLRVAEQVASAAPPSMRIAEFIDLSRALLGTPSSGEIGPDAGIIQTMTAITPALRARFVFENTETGGGAGSLPPQRVPFALLMIYLITEASALAGTRTITYQSISKIAATFHPLITMFALIDTLPSWRRDAAIDPSGFRSAKHKMAFMRIARELLHNTTANHPKRLADILLAESPLEAADRIVFLKTVARAVYGKLRISSVDSRAVERRVPVHKRFKNQLHRWAIVNLSDAALEHAYARSLDR
jgi:hypothetical protein